MGSNYVDDLEAWVKAKAIKKPDANLAAFLVVRDMVKARLDEGYSATIIHGFLRAGQHIDICYDTFLKYVHRYVQPPRKGPKARGKTTRTVGHAPGAGIAGTGKRDSSSGIVGFTFNPNPKREDLI
ncbi:TraK family protein [Massilia sp. S19_KUP03_FR1]|uniref:TraK family protein n=1 Tax=Massilia sp. S19_KUP03_FR1 TaxID=3025503 RepID=UPI002FCDA52B